MSNNAVGYSPAEEFNRKHMSQSLLSMGDHYPDGPSTSSEAFERYKDLLFMLTWRDIKIRYKQSIMGFAWAVLMPILIVGAGLVVQAAFSTISGKPIDRLSLFSVAAKSVPWAFFVGAIRFATNSLVANKELVTKIYFPREILPLAAIFANLFDFGVAAGLLALVLAVSRIGISVQLLWVPVLISLLVLFCAGLGILLACANLFFRDVKYLIEVLLTYGIFFTPVFYSAASLGKWKPLLLLNPVGPILESLNDVIILHRPPSTFWIAYSAAWSIFGFWVSWVVFKRAESSFAESV